MKESIIIAVFLLGPVLIITAIGMMALTVVKVFFRMISKLFILSSDY